MGEINMWQRSKVNRWRQKGPEDYVCSDAQAQYRQRCYAIFDSDQMSKYRSIGIKEEVDALLNIESFKLINEPQRGFPLITT